MMIYHFLRRLVQRLPVRAAALLLLIVAFAGILAWCSRPTSSCGNENVQLAATGAVENATPLPLEWQENSDQTIGIVFGGILLVLIIVGGTLSTILRNRIPGAHR